MSQRFPRFVYAAVALASTVLAACDERSAVQAGTVAADSTARSATAFDAARWSPPSEAEIPGDSLGASIRRGLALVVHTTDSLPTHAPGNITCANCHINAGRNVDAIPLMGSFARYPRYLERTGAVVGLADRVNYCFTRSLAGSKLPAESREMQDILTYLAWLSRGIPIGEGNKLPGARGLPDLPDSIRGDTKRGAQVYAAKCVSCHQTDGAGTRTLTPPVPALWGAKSFSVGASMTRQSKSASFIWHNMPWGLGKTLTHQEASDVAAYVSSQARPDSPGKERDWPLGGAPSDVPYATRGHQAYQSPALLPRSNPAAAIVDAPRRVRGAREQ